MLFYTHYSHLLFTVYLFLISLFLFSILTLAWNISKCSTISLHLLSTKHVTNTTDLMLICLSSPQLSVDTHMYCADTHKHRYTCKHSRTHTHKRGEVVLCVGAPGKERQTDGWRQISDEYRPGLLSCWDLRPTILHLNLPSL